LAGLSTLIWAILTKQINIGGGGNGGHVPVSFQKKVFIPVLVFHLVTTNTFILSYYNYFLKP
jgi:hypothetical protein